jgi:hypothetical protein
VAKRSLEQASVSNLESGAFLALQRKDQEIDGEKLQKGLAKLVLALVQTLADILEKQAARRVESGTLSEEQVERLGLAFMQIRERTADVAEKFGLSEEDLGIRLSGEQGHVTLVDVVDKLIEQGTVISGDVAVAVAGVDLVTLRLLATITSR